MKTWTLEQAKHDYKAGHLKSFYIEQAKACSDCWHIYLEDEHGSSGPIVDGCDGMMVFLSIVDVIFALQEIGFVFGDIDIFVDGAEYAEEV